MCLFLFHLLLIIYIHIFVLGLCYLRPGARSPRSPFRVFESVRRGERCSVSFNGSGLELATDALKLPLGHRSVLEGTSPETEKNSEIPKG